MKQTFLWLGSLLLLTNVFVFSACDNDDDDQPVQQNIVETLQADPDFSLLVDAVVKAELQGVLSNAGTFTLFAPNNTALQAFLDAAGTGSVENTPKDLLGTILTNHVYGTSYGATDFQTGYYNTVSAVPFEDNSVSASSYVSTNNGVTINGEANVIEADKITSNGIIHEINKVIAPPTVVTFALADPTFSTLVAALTRADLTVDFVTTLTGDGPFTVFAPTNEAFQALLDSNDDWNSLDDIPVETLQTVLLYHVTDAGNVRSTELSDGQTVNTLADGKDFEININGGNVSITADNSTANIIAVDVQAQNGVVHAIDAVLLPGN